MSGKYMKIKRVIIPTLTMVIIASQLFGCASASKNDTYNMLQESTEIELEYADLETVDDKEISSLDWIELGSLTTYKDLRASWDNILGITGSTGAKSGMLYKNWQGETQDNYLAEVILSTEFVDFVSNEDNYNKLVDAVKDNFTDSDDLTDEQLFSIGLNAYFSLLPMEDEAETYANSYVSRAQFLALATIDVDESSNAFTDTKNGGDILTEQGLKSKAEEISYAIQNPDKGCPEDIYKTLVKAQELGLIGSETAWDEAITLSDAITLYYNTALSKLETTNNSDENKSDVTESHTSETWSEYSETYDYMAEHTSASMAHMLNPDVYGTETAGKATEDFPFSLQPDTGEYIKRLELTTTKGYPIEAYWYVEPNTVQFVYTGEVSPYGGWFTDSDSMDVMDAYFNYEKTTLDITHEQKIQILGEPSMTEDEVIAAMKVKYGM